LYHRTDMASNVGNLITNSVNNEGATVIGIFSEWGSGKTDFLMRLKNVLIDLEKNDYDQINQVFEFNPWKYSAGEGVIQSFFNSFEQILIKYNDDIDTLFRDYLKDIMGNSRSLDLKFFQLLMFNMFDNSKDLTVQQKIKNTLNSTGKRFVIYIDDIDRLTGKEIVEVFKLVRVIADFPNVFFVITMDYNYVVKTVDDTNEIGNIEQYIKKIYDVSFRLPIIKKETITYQLIKLIGNDFDKESSTKLEQTLNRINTKPILIDKVELFGLIEKMLENSRDVLQFYNSIKGHLVNLNDEIDLTDLILLELLKVYSFRIYNSLSIQDESLLIVKNGSYTFVCEEIKKTFDPIISEVLECLVDNKGKSIGRFCNVINHYLYFSYTLPENMVSRKEFIGLLEKSDDDFLEKVNCWVSNKEEDLHFI
jgi:predicted KAP-like P-loop ATPase